MLQLGLGGVNSLELKPKCILGGGGYGPSDQGYSADYVSICQQKHSAPPGEDATRRQKLATQSH